MRRFRHIAVTLLVVLPTLATAQGRNLYLEEGKRLIERGKPGEAIEELRRGLDMPGLPESHRIEILGWMGAAFHLSGRELEANQPWEERVRLVPAAELPDSLPPEVRQAYLDVRERTVIIDHLAPPGAFAGRPLKMHAQLVDKQARAGDVLLYARRRGEESYRVTTFQPKGEGWVAELNLPPIAGQASGYELEYYLVAQSSLGEILHSLGDPARPLTVQVKASPAGVLAASDTTYERLEAVDVGPNPDDATGPAMPPAKAASGASPWIWVGLGTAAVLLGGGAAFFLSQGEDVPTTSLGVIRYPLSGDD